MADEIYFVAGGLDCVVPVGNVVESTNYTVSGFSLTTIKTMPGASIGFNCPFIDQATGAPVTVTDFWTRFTVQNSDYAVGPVVQWLDSAGDAWVRLYQNSNFNFSLQQNVAGTWTAVGSPLLGTTNATFDVYIQIGSVGQIQFFINSISSGGFTGDTSAFGSIASLAAGFCDNTNQYFQQMIVANFNTIGHTVRTRAVTAAGANQEWTGPYGNVATYPLDPSQFITSAVAAELNTYTGTTLSATPAGQIIRGVALGTYVRRDTTGPQNIKGVLDISSTEYDAAYNMANVGLGFSGNLAIWANNPATSAPWANITEANCDFGVKSVA